MGGQRFGNVSVSHKQKPETRPKWWMSTSAYIQGGEPGLEAPCDHLGLKGDGPAPIGEGWNSLPTIWLL